MKDVSVVLKRTLLAVVIVAVLVGGIGCLGPTPASDATATEVEDGIFELVNAERLESGLSALTRSQELDELASDYATTGFTQESRYETNLLYILHNAWQLDFSGEVRFDEDTAGEQVDFCISEQDMHDALLTDEAMETGVAVVAVDSTAYFVQVFDVINTKGADGEPIVLAENQEATDPTWEELVDFLEADTTDSITYDWNAFICGDFAEAVHNNAEAAGIRAAFVPVRLNQEPGHACNAFNVDGNTIFIDVINGDKVAYVEVGKDYGVIPVAGATLFTYAFLEGYVVLYEAYQQDLADYNAQVVAYNDFEPIPAPYTTRQQWYNALTAWLAELDAERAALGIEGETSFHPTESLDTTDPEVAGYYVHW